MGLSLILWNRQRFGVWLVIALLAFALAGTAGTTTSCHRLTLGEAIVTFYVGVAVLFIGTVALIASDVESTGDRPAVGYDCEVTNNTDLYLRMFDGEAETGLIPPHQARTFILGDGVHNLRWVPRDDSAACNEIGADLVIGESPGYYEVTLGPLTGPPPMPGI